MNDPYERFSGKTVATIEVSDEEFLITFADGSEISVSPRITGGDYGEPYLEVVPAEKT